MIEQDTVKLLRECDAGIRMGTESIDEVVEYVHAPEMRDLLNMYYMGDYGGRQYSRIIDGVEEPLDPEFIANQRLPDFSKMRY